MGKENKPRMSIWSKTWKSFAALAIVYGLLSPTKITMSLNVWVFSLITLVFFVIYWHLFEKFNDKYDSIKKFFLDLQKDIKDIKKKVNKR